MKVLSEQEFRDWSHHEVTKNFVDAVKQCRLEMLETASKMRKGDTRDTMLDRAQGVQEVLDLLEKLKKQR